MSAQGPSRRVRAAGGGLSSERAPTVGIAPEVLSGRRGWHSHVSCARRNTRPAFLICEKACETLFHLASRGATLSPDNGAAGDCLRPRPPGSRGSLAPAALRRSRSENRGGHLSSPPSVAAPYFPAPYSPTSHAAGQAPLERADPPSMGVVAWGRDPSPPVRNRRACCAQRNISRLLRICEKLGDILLPYPATTGRGPADNRDNHHALFVTHPRFPRGRHHQWPDADRDDRLINPR